MTDCTHEWQPADDLRTGRYRCILCLAVGYRKSAYGKHAGPIVQYKREPAWITTWAEFGDYDSFYDVGDGGKCPSMDQQELTMYDFNTLEEEDKWNG